MEEKAVDAPVRFFAIAYADTEGYWETFVFATSAEDALTRYWRWVRNNDNWDSITHKVVVDVLEAELNDFGVMISTNPIIMNAEMKC